MFQNGDDVQVFLMRPGHFEPLWHPAKIVGPSKGADGRGSASFDVLVDGGVPATVAPANIRKV